MSRPRAFSIVPSPAGEGRAKSLRLHFEGSFNAVLPLNRHLPKDEIVDLLATGRSVTGLLEDSTGVSTLHLGDKSIAFRADPQRIRELFGLSLHAKIDPDPRYGRPVYQIYGQEPDRLVDIPLKLDQ